MITYSGVHIQTIGGAEGIPTSMDIAVQAARICRFGGAVWYPLLPHLVFVGCLAYRRSGWILNGLWGLLHDAHETVTADVPAPFKCDCMRREQSAIDARLIAHYSAHYFGTRAFAIDHGLVKQCDLDACDLEAVELGLPGYASIVAALHGTEYEQHGRKVYQDKDDLKLLHHIRQQFGRENPAQAPLSFAVRDFAYALDIGTAGELGALAMVFERWMTTETR